MGRGGKNKKKKEEKEDLAIGALSIGDTQPSTSRADVAPVAAKPEEPAHQEEAPAKVAEQEPEADEEVVGLGIGEGKRRRKKKKPAAQAGSEKPTVTPTPETQSLQPLIQPPSSTRPSSSTQPLSSTQPRASTQPSDLAPIQLKAPTLTQPGSAPIQQSGITPQQLTPAYPQQGAPPPRSQFPPGVPIPFQPPLGQPSNAPIRPWSQTQGQGRGRGVVASPVAPGVPQQRPGFGSMPTQQVPSTPQVAPQPTPTQQPKAPQQSATIQRQSETPPSDIVNPFKIPDKVLARQSTVQCRPIQVLTNYLKMSIKALEVHRYDVAIKPDRPKKLMSKVFQMVRDRHFPKIPTAFDQRKNCYALKLLGKNTSDRLETKVEALDDNGAKMSFEVIFKHTGIVKFDTILKHMQNGGSSLNTPMEAIQCIDVVLQQGTVDKYVKTGRQYFRRPNQPLDLGQGLEMWTGLFQSAIFTSQPFVNIDVAHKGFPRAQPVIDALVRDFRLDPTRPLDRQRGSDQFIAFLKGLRVTALIAGGVRRREYICNSLVDPPNRLNFVQKDQATGKTTKLSVQKYFEVEKKCRLKYPDLNCLWVGPRDKTIYYPMEFLGIVPGQALARQLSDKQQPIMVREAATPPSIRMKKIYEVMAEMKYATNPQFKEFGLTISDKFTQVDAKILRPPTLSIGGGNSLEPRGGVWQTNGFVKPSALLSWGLILVDVYDQNSCRVYDLIDLLKRTARRLGMAVDEPKYTNFNVRAIDLNKTLYAAIEKNVNFMFIIVSGRDRDCYHKVKRMAELEVGILTQCIKENTAARKMNEQTMRNILLKVNSKLMGVNQVLDNRSIPNCIKEGGVMVVGADVTHPSPDQSNVPSIAAVTASIDTKCFTYNIEMSIQTPKKEMIVQFEDMMLDHFRIYKAHQNSLPKKIYVFRDGVSEGQFEQVMNSEIVALQRAYQRMAGPNVKPEILFLLVQKRHHTRFFSMDREPRNVEPGTVVDTVIVHPRELDFYLVSHAAIKGTARPTRYHAVCNDGGVPSVEVEQLAYYLCYLYARCTRSVSYPTPTYYAHLACMRARSLTHGDQFNNMDLERNPKRLRVLDKMLQTSRMFFV